MRSTSLPSPFEIGYICGLIVGEGSFTGDRQQPCLAVKLHSNDPEPLHSLYFHLGGNLYGPYLHGGRNYYLWRLTGRSLRDSLDMFNQYLPKSRKREQFEAWLVKYGLGRFMSVEV